MDLQGWDTVSVTSMSRINESLAASADKLLTNFNFEDGGLHIQGRFGAWQIRPGGSVGLVYLEIPILEGTLDGVPGKATQDISGTTAILEVALKLMPASDGSGRHELRFDLIIEGLRASRPLVAPVRTEDPDNKLDSTSATLLTNVVAACLTANGESVSYVFASVGVSDPTKTTWLTPTDSDWCYLQLGDGSSYLAILSVVEPRPTKDLVRAVDPKILEGGGSAFFAVETSLFLKNLLTPYMSSAFRGGGSFRYNAGKKQVQSAKAIRLPKMKHGIATVSPRIDNMQLGIKGGSLVTHSKSKSDISTFVTSAVFNCDVTTTMPFFFDKKTRNIGFKPDHHPKEKHSLKLPKVLQFLVGWLVNIILEANKSSIVAAITSIAKRMQVMNTPPPAVLGWSGQRSFEVSDARLEGCFWFADQRAS